MATVPLPEHADVVVAGAGTAGLALALALARDGHRVAVLEKHRAPIPAPRGEILQPNGLAALERLGVLGDLLSRPHAPTDRYHFRRIGNGPLATFDYRELDTPHPTTLVLLPEVLEACLADALSGHRSASVHTGALCTGVVRNRGDVCGAVVRQGSAETTVRCRLLAGADGAASRVRRALGVGGRTIAYPEGYLTGLLTRPSGFDRDGYYYLGHNEILGLFPVSDDTLYFFYLLPAARYAALREDDVGWLRERMRRIHPGIAGPAEAIRSWKQLSFFPCIRVTADRWYAPGAALLGDAAHSVNPHVAQGKNLALEDALCLADQVSGELAGGAIRPIRLHAYERARRPPAEALRQLGDELVLFWNAGNPVLTALRDRAFRGLGRNARLRRRVTASIAGLGDFPLSPWDRLRLLAGL